MRRLSTALAALVLAVAGCGGTSTPSPTPTASTALWDGGFGPGIASAPIVPFLDGSLIGYGAALPEDESFPDANEVPLDEAQVIYSDGTPEGTRLLFAGALISEMGDRALAVEADGVGYFIARDPKSETTGLYRTDGTAEGTSFVRAAEATAIGAVVRDGSTAVCMSESILRGQEVERGFRCDLFDDGVWRETREMLVLSDGTIGDQLYPFAGRLYLDSNSVPLTYLDPFSESTPVGTLAISDASDFYGDDNYAEFLLTGVLLKGSTYPDSTDTEFLLLKVRRTTSTTAETEGALYAITADGTVRALARERASDVAPDGFYHYSSTADGSIYNVATVSGFVEAAEGTMVASKVVSRVFALNQATGTPEEITIPVAATSEPLEFVSPWTSRFQVPGDTGSTYAIGESGLYAVEVLDGGSGPAGALVLIADFPEALEAPFIFFASDSAIYFQYPEITEADAPEAATYTWTWRYVNRYANPAMGLSALTGYTLSNCGGRDAVARGALYTDCGDGTGAIYRFDGGEVTRLMLAPEGERWEIIDLREIGDRAVAIYVRETANGGAPSRYYLAELPTR
jgi:hypothetical protein